MDFLSIPQVWELHDAAINLKETLVIRYAVFNGLCPMEIAGACREHLYPEDHILVLPKRHWKTNCVTTIDTETIRLQLLYSGPRETGPLILNPHGRHLSRQGVWYIVKQVARRTSIPNYWMLSPRVLKYTFARMWLLTPGNTIGTLQRAFSHKHLSSTAHYLKFILPDVRREKHKLMEHVAPVIAR